ncbi:hypothetical protein Tco_0064412 [Tanacetum coccineum]
MQQDGVMAYDKKPKEGVFITLVFPPDYVREKNGSNLSTSLKQICLGSGIGETSKEDSVGNNVGDTSEDEYSLSNCSKYKMSPSES